MRKKGERHFLFGDLKRKGEWGDPCQGARTRLLFFPDQTQSFPRAFQPGTGGPAETAENCRARGSAAPRSFGTPRNSIGRVQVMTKSSQRGQ